MKWLYRLLPLLCLPLYFSCLAQAQLICNSNASPPLIRGEGITERVGDIALNCAGGVPGMQITGNFSIFLNVNITNRVSGNAVADVVFTIDSGAGPQPVTVPGVIAGPGNLVYNGLSFMLSPTGTAVLRIANIRAAAIQLKLLPQATVQALLAFNSASLVSLTNVQLTVGTVDRALYAGASSKLVCSQAGSPLPQIISFSQLLAAGTAFETTRVTEGFADAFETKSAWPNLNADHGERIIVQYSGFPAGAAIYVPDIVAGSDAVQPTGGGDFGVPASGGQYSPSATGTLLLARVPNADANGAGGQPIYTPGLIGSGTVSFDSVNQVTLTNGTGVAVYEVVDANPNTIESAQFPTFLGLAAQSVSTPITTNANVYLAALSTVESATASDPIPRFSAVPAPGDCSIVGDCNASYFPRLSVNTTPVVFTAYPGGSYQVAYAQVVNKGGGVLQWASTVTYASAAGWLTLAPASGVGNGTIRLDATPGSLGLGTYQATVLVDAGPVTGSQQIPVTLKIVAGPSPPVQSPVITGVVNAASFAAGPVAPGSLATVQGTNFSGTNVSVTFNGMPAQILYSNNTQINVLVPAALGSSASATVVVSADGNQSTGEKVSLASMAPAIFPNGILNQDFRVNSAKNPAPSGSVIQIFATGLSGTGAITATIAGQAVKAPYYGGPAPGLPGVQQVDLILPSTLSGSTVSVTVCGDVGGQPVCSPAVSVPISH